MKILILLFITTITILFSKFSVAHSGGLNASGCHSGSKPYHCHRSPSEVTISSSGNTRLRCDLGSNSADCTQPQRTLNRDQSSGNENSAIATGAQNPKPNQEYLLKPGYSNAMLRLQILLVRHCAHLPIDLADGVESTATSDALVVFQKTHGILPGSISAVTRTLDLLRSNPTGNCKPTQVLNFESNTKSSGKYISSNTREVEVNRSQIVLEPKETKDVFDEVLVRNIQTHLTNLGFNPGPIDGLFGPSTSASIKRYQRSKFQIVNGIPTFKLLFHLIKEGN